MRRLFILFLFITTPFTSYAEVVERIVAIINDKIITESDIQDYTVKLKNKGMVDDLLVENPDELVKDRKKLIENLINERLVDSEVKRQNLEITVERVEQEIRSIAAKNKLSRDQLKQALKEQGINFAEYQDFLKKRLERQALIDKVVTSRIKISDEEVAAYYLSTKGATGREIYEYTLAQILFLPKTGDVEGAKARAEAVSAKIRSGASFESMASQYSEDPNFTTGGVLGTFKSGEFLKELEDAVKDLPVGGISSVVKSKTGFHILKLIDKKLIADPAYEKAREEIRNILYQKAFKKQFSFWLDQKRQEAFIRIN